MKTIHGKNMLIKTVENIISKNIGLLCKPKQLLNNESLKNIYISVMFTLISTMLTLLGQALTQQNSKKYIIYKSKKRK